MTKMSKLTFLLPSSLHVTQPSVLVPFDICEFYGKHHICPHLELGCTQWMHPREQFCKSPQKITNRMPFVCIPLSVGFGWGKYLFVSVFFPPQTWKVGMSPSDEDLRVDNESTHSDGPADCQESRLQGFGAGSQDSMDCSHSVSTGDNCRIWYISPLLGIASRSVVLPLGIMLIVTLRGVLEKKPTGWMQWN